MLLARRRDRNALPPLTSLIHMAFIAEGEGSVYPAIRSEEPNVRESTTFRSFRLSHAAARLVEKEKRRRHSASRPAVVVRFREVRLSSSRKGWNLFATVSSASASAQPLTCVRSASGAVAD